MITVPTRTSAVAACRARSRETPAAYPAAAATSVASPRRINQRTRPEGQTPFCFHQSMIDTGSAYTPWACALRCVAAMPGGLARHNDTAAGVAEPLASLPRAAAVPSRRLGSVRHMDNPLAAHGADAGRSRLLRGQCGHELNPPRKRLLRGSDGWAHPYRGETVDMLAKALCGLVL